jgi:hypothetical protein
MARQSDGRKGPSRAVERAPAHRQVHGKSGNPADGWTAGGRSCSAEPSPRRTAARLQVGLMIADARTACLAVASMCSAAFPEADRARDRHRNGELAIILGVRAHPGATLTGRRRRPAARPVLVQVPASARAISRRWRLGSRNSCAAMRSARVIPSDSSRAIRPATASDSVRNDAPRSMSSRFSSLRRGRAFWRLHAHAASSGPSRVRLGAR